MGITIDSHVFFGKMKEHDGIYQWYTLLLNIAMEKMPICTWWFTQNGGFHGKTLGKHGLTMVMVVDIVVSWWFIQRILSR